MTDHRRAHVLTGGGTGAVDKVDGAGLAAGDTIECLNSDGLFSYVNIQNSAAENSPYVIRPNTNPGTNSWHLVVPHGPMSHVEVEKTAAQTFPHATDTKILYNSSIEDSLVEYDDTTNHRFTAKNPGRYSVSASLLYESHTWTSSQSNSLLLYKNGTLYRTLHRLTGVSGTIFAGVKGGTMLNLLATDYIEFWANQGSGVTLAMQTGTDFNYMTIDRIM